MPRAIGLAIIGASIMNNNGEVMARLRCAMIGVVSSIATVAIFLLGLALIMRFVDIRIESYPMSHRTEQTAVR